MRGRERLVFALDVASREAALDWVERLRGEVGAFKVGLELFVAAGPALVREVVSRGARVFLDLKFHDIPATMAGAAAAAAASGAFLLNVHALAGRAGMARAAAAARTGAATAGLPAPRVIAVTVLTSHADPDLEQLGLRGPAGAAVLRLAAEARAAGLDGVVASPLEAARIREQWPTALVVTPGVRPAAAAGDDQRRTATPAAAVAAGADLLVVGRPLREAADPVAAARAICAEIQGTRDG